MPLNPNIALSAKGFELQDPLVQYGKIAAIQNAQNQNALAQYQLGAAQRTETSQNVLADAYAKSVDPTTGKIDYNKLNSLVAAGGGGAQLPAIQKSRMENETAALTQQETGFKVQKAKKDFIAQAQRDTSQNPSDANIIAYKEDLIANPLFSEQEKQQMIASSDRLLAMPINERKMFMSSQGATVSELKPTVSVGRTGIVQTPAFGGAATVVPGTEAAFQATPGEKMTDARARAQMAQSERHFQENQAKLDRPVFNAAAGGFISPPTKDNPQGKFTPATDIQTSKDQQAAIKALQSAGYDPVTGEDNISKLISKSTSGGLQAAGAATLSFLGKTTEGRKAISALEGTANQIATDLAGGKLGAGISNTDREFIVGALGDVSNPMKTAEERLAGWTAAKERMMRVGLIPAPKSGKPAAPAAPSNIDALLDKYK